jgi:DNA-binding response OmpR family regulator
VSIVTKVLIVDDERGIIEVLEAYLERQGYEIQSAENGVEALRKVKSFNPDLMILDLMLPDISGEEVCRLVRMESDLPILMLTAKSAEDDRINGIVIGADDYVTKPFSPREVIVRVQAILRRTQKAPSQAQVQPEYEILSFNQRHLTIDPLKKEVLVGKELVTLTPIEYKLLTNMADYPGRVYSRLDLLEKIQEEGMYYEGYERSIDTHIKNLRKKIEVDSRTPEYILTVFGMGYKFGGKKDVANPTR